MNIKCRTTCSTDGSICIEAEEAPAHSDMGHILFIAAYVAAFM